MIHRVGQVYRNEICGTMILIVGSEQRDLHLVHTVCVLDSKRRLYEAAAVMRLSDWGNWSQIWKHVA